MIKNGGKGNSTLTGIAFEKKVDILKSLDEVNGYSIENENVIFYDGQKIATAYPKHKIYSEFLKENEVDYKVRINRKMLPDQAIFIHGTRTMNIIEVKTQSVSGSVDEKITTCDFKKKQYAKLFEGLVSEVNLIYCLSKFFENEKYNDALNYIEESECVYHFNKIPLSEVGLPEK